MGNGFTFGFIFFLVVAGVLGYIYWKYEVPKKENMIPLDGNNISIIASYNSQDVITGYIIKYGEIIVKGNTSKGSYEQINIPANFSITITNENLENQDFYIETKQINVVKDNLRVDFKLEKAQELNVTIKDTKPLEVNLYSNNYKDIKICLKSSFNYIFVKALNLDEISKIIGYESWDNCYDTHVSLKDTNLALLIDYTIFSTPNNNDYINLAIISEGNSKTIKLK